MENLGSAKLSYHKYSPKAVTELTGVQVEDFVLVAYASSKHMLEGKPDNIKVWVAGRESTPVLAAAARLAIMDDLELIEGMPYIYTKLGDRGGMQAHLMLGVSYDSADKAVEELIRKEETLNAVPQVGQRNLHILTPEFLLAAANEARDVFEILDSRGPLQPGEVFDGAAEETAELLEELVRVRAPQYVTELAWHGEGDDPRPIWKIRAEQQHTPDEYDNDEPVAHIVQAIDKIANVPGTPVVDSLTGVAQAALLRARDSAITDHQRDSIKAALEAIEMVPTNYDSQ